MIFRNTIAFFRLLTACRTRTTDNIIFISALITYAYVLLRIKRTVLCPRLGLSGPSALRIIATISIPCLYIRRIISNNYAGSIHANFTSTTSWAVSTSSSWSTIAFWLILAALLNRTINNMVFVWAHKTYTYISKSAPPTASIIPPIKSLMTFAGRIPATSGFPLLYNPRRIEKLNFLFKITLDFVFDITLGFVLDITPDFVQRSSER